MLTASALTSRMQGYASGLGVGGQGVNQDKDALSQSVYEPFEWTAPGLVFSFEFLDKKLRSRTVLPADYAHVGSRRRQFAQVLVQLKDSRSREQGYDLFAITARVCESPLTGKGQHDAERRLRER